VLLETHFSQIVKVKLAPSYIDIRKIRQKFSAILFLIKHFSQTEIRNSFKLPGFPFHDTNSLKKLLFSTVKKETEKESAIEHFSALFLLFQ